MATESTLPAPAMQASKAALNSALADLKASEDETKGDSKEGSATDDMEDGEIQEVDMEAQAEGIRTVFSDPKNFNVTVCTFLLGYMLLSDGVVSFVALSTTRDRYAYSILLLRFGLYGSTLPLRKAVIYLRRRLQLLCRKRHYLKLLEQPPLWAGWRTSRKSSASIASRPSGGMHSLLIERF